MQGFHILSSWISLISKLLIISLYILFCYLGYTLSIFHCIGVFVVLNLMFSIGPALGAAPFILVYNGFIYSLSESILFCSIKRVPKQVTLDYGKNLFVLTTPDFDSYMIKDFYSYLVPFFFIKKTMRKKRLRDKLLKAGFFVDDM